MTRILSIDLRFLNISQRILNILPRFLNVKSEFINLEVKFLNLLNVIEHKLRCVKAPWSEQCWRLLFSMNLSISDQIIHQLIMIMFVVPSWRLRLIVLFFVSLTASVACVSHTLHYSPFHYISIIIVTHTWPQNKHEAQIQTAHSHGASSTLFHCKFFFI